MNENFWSGFEKRANVGIMIPVSTPRYSSTVGLKTQAAKDEFKREAKKDGTIGGGMGGALAGGLAGGVIRRGGKGALIGAGVGALAGGVGGRILGAHRGNVRGEKGYADVRSHSREGVIDKIKKYHDLNKEAQEQDKGSNWGKGALIGAGLGAAGGLLGGRAMVRSIMKPQAGLKNAIRASAKKFSMPTGGAVNAIRHSPKALGIVGGGAGALAGAGAGSLVKKD